MQRRDTARPVRPNCVNCMTTSVERVAKPRAAANVTVTIFVRRKARQEDSVGNAIFDADVNWKGDAWHGQGASISTKRSERRRTCSGVRVMKGLRLPT